MITLA